MEKGEGSGIGGMMESVRWGRIMDPSRAEEGGGAREG
jgi:hypothetical protein